MEKKTISAGIIGAGGFIGQEHLKRLTKRIDGVAVTALYDINKEKTDALAAAYGAESMESVDALIASDKVDAIVITAWDGVHAEMTNKAIAAGKPVFCEKPLATTKADCAEIVRIEQAAGRNLVQVGFMRRYDPDYRKIKAILDSGELGKPLMAHCISRTPRIAAGFTNAMQVTNVLIHEIDQFRWLFGEELVRGQMLAARNTAFAADGLNDPQLALMWTESNILIDVDCSVNSYYGYEIGMEIVCEKGTIRLPLPAEPIVRSRLKVGNEIIDNWAERFPEAYDNELQHWINHLRGIEPTAGPGSKDGFAACCIADAMIASQTSGKVEAVNFDM